MVLHLPHAVALKQRLDPGLADPGVVRLKVDAEEWKRGNADPTATEDAWIDATLVDGENLVSVKLRRRGDASVHWTTPKRSFTLKTPKGSHFRGFRRVGLSGKQVLSSYLANRLPFELGVFASYTAIAPVFLNDQFNGVFRFIELVDESFLRRRGKLPGNIFRADAAERGEVFKYLPRNVFVNPYIWSRVAENDVPGVPSDAGLVELLDATNGTSFEAHLRLMRLVEREEVARLVASMLVVGDPYHMSGVNNQFWYEDPSTGKLQPIPWDLRLLDLARPPQRIGNLFLRAALRDPYLVDEALTTVHEWSIDDRLYQRAEELTREAFDRYRPHFEFDRLRGDLISDVGSPEEVLPILRRNLETLESWMADSRVRYDARSVAADIIVLDLQTQGYAGVDLVSVQFSGSPEAASETSLETARLLADRNRNGTLDSADEPLRGRWEVDSTGARFRLDEPEALLPGWSTRGRGIEPGSVHYRFFVSGESLASAVGSGVRPELRNRITGQESEATQWGDDVAILASDSWHPWQYPTRDARTHRLSSSVRLAQDLRVPAGDRLLIEPGTIIRLDPDVSIVAQGRVEALGTPDRPIRFVQAVDGRPWGALVLQGEGASGSRFEHVQFAGGGGTRVGRVEYKGMVSVHHARDVQFNDARFADNLRSDDALNAAHAEVVLRDCEFTRAAGDAIDFDFSSGAIEGCRFEDSRNDAIDLMTSSPRIVGNYIVGSGDKGISIGERSDPLIFDNLIESSTRGIEVKDGSRPLLLHNRITGSEIGVLQQAKNWRYGAGGWASLYYMDVSGNDSDYEADDRSRLTLYESRVGQPVTLDGDGDPPDWLYARFGVIGGSHEPGVLEGWTSVEPVLPVERFSFLEDLEPEFTWVAEGGVYRVGLRDRSLVAWVERRAGAIARTVDWRLDDSERRYQAVIEVGGRDVQDLEVVFVSDRGDVRRALRVPDDPRLFRSIALDLPRGEYSQVRFDLVPVLGARRVDPRTGLMELRSGRLEVRDVAVYALPVDASARLTGGPTAEPTRLTARATGGR